MRLTVRILALAALLSLVAISIWASHEVGVVATIQDVLRNPSVGTNPWFVATLFDAYFAFLWIWLWIVWREGPGLKSGVWLLLILAFGNIAIALYVLLALRQLPPSAPLDAMFSREH